MEKRVVGVYENANEAKAAVEDLQNKGYKYEDISIVAKDIEDLGKAADEVKPKESDGMIAGAATGGAVGLTGLFLGLSYLAVPGIGPILAAGPIISVLGGAVAGMATNAGGLTKALQDLGLSEEESRQYQDDIKNGKIIVAVKE
ncbi:general stress protein [Peribacillus kribbensis]|uniref:general stress protein n=1 Tax=Peribacillus kribbensis TaxID=356658 RepID=UPI0003FF837D|nr:general stress protein [Peribacillus kribbensis]